jgi:hypothetical protein
VSELRSGKFSPASLVMTESEKEKEKEQRFAIPSDDASVS